MAEKRDFLDDIIDIQSDFQAVSNPLGSLADALTGETKVKEWDPSRYKDRPTVSKGSCIRYLTDGASSCRACMDVCPVDAIEIAGGRMSISDDCRECGLCVGVCPSEAFKSRLVSPRNLYDAVARGAMAHEMCYVTCTRALGRYPKPNELVIACVGAISPEVWFSVLSDFGNVAVYLPLGICDRCRTTTGENCYVEAIGQAEEWSGQALGLKVDESDLNHSTRREWERKQFVNNMVKNTALVMGKTNPMVAAVRNATSLIEEHNKRIRRLESSLNVLSGNPTDHRRRTLVQRRQLVMTTLQTQPELVDNLDFKVATCDSGLCTMCGDCVKVCPTHAIELDKQGHVRISASHCIGCDACTVACPEDALSLIAAQAEDIVIADESEAKSKANEEKQKQELERLKKEGKRRFEQGMSSLGKFVENVGDSLEKLADEAADKSGGGH